MVASNAYSTGPRPSPTTSSQGYSAGGALDDLTMLANQADGEPQSMSPQSELVMLRAKVKGMEGRRGTRIDIETFKVFGVHTATTKKQLVPRPTRSLQAHTPAHTLTPTPPTIADFRSGSPSCRPRRQSTARLKRAQWRLRLRIALWKR